MIEISQTDVRLERTRESLESLWEWLEKCDPEHDSKLMIIIQRKIKAQLENLQQLLTTYENRRLFN